MDIIDVMELIENFGLLGKDFIFLESKEEQKDFDLICVKLLKIKYQEVEDGLMLSTSSLGYWVRVCFATLFRFFPRLVGKNQNLLAIHINGYPLG